jgi:hypothetical protein
LSRRELSDGVNTDLLRQCRRGPLPVCYDLGRPRDAVGLQQEKQAIMSARLALAMLILTLLGATGCAARSRQPENANAAGLPGKDDCLWVLYIDRWERLDPSTLLVYTANNNYFLVKLAQPVADLSNQQAVGFYASNRDDRVCGGGEDLLLRASDSLRDPLVAVRSIKASVARQYQKTITPTAAASTTTATSASRAARRRKPGPADSAPAQPTDASPAPAAPAAQPTDTTAPPAAGP